LAEGTENFIWIPSSEPRRHGGVFAALAAIVCVWVIGNSPMRGFVDPFDRHGIGAELSTAGEQRIVAEPTLNGQVKPDRSRVEHREATEPVLMLSSHSKAGVPVRRRSGLDLSPLSGEPARRLQAKVGVPADGVFGGSTEEALKAWQRKNGLAADGVAGPDTLVLMGLYDLVLLKRGAHGDAVKKLQEELAIRVDGQFGPRTEKAVRDYQKKNRLVADGMAGLATLAHMQLFKAVPAVALEAAQGPASSR
jgi:murein L,D-transpeptidase YcbB/YkuD